MTRGTTAQFKFIMPYAKDELAWIVIQFWQSNNLNELLPIVKTKEDCVVGDDPKELVISLTPEETSWFSDKYKAKMQVRAQHILTGTVFGMKKPQLITVYPMPDDIIIENPTLPPVNKDGWVFIDGGTIVDK